MHEVGMADEVNNFEITTKGIGRWFHIMKWLNFFIILDLFYTTNVSSGDQRTAWLFGGLFNNCYSMILTIKSKTGLTIKNAYKIGTSLIPTLLGLTFFIKLDLFGQIVHYQEFRE